MSSTRENVTVYNGDANSILLKQVFPHARYDAFRRALCILDPYGLDLDWSLIRAAGKSKSIEIFLNFPVMDMNRNVLWRDQDKVSSTQKERMNRFWGDESWRSDIYTKGGSLFNFEEKRTNEEVAEAFRRRLNKVAGFSFVPTPVPMRNSTGAIVYYLFFAAHQAIASNIVTDIFNKYRMLGGTNG